MTNRPSAHLAFSIAVLGAMLSASPCLAQGPPMGSGRLRHSHLRLASTAVPAPGALPVAATAYAYTWINFPGAASSDLWGVNLGAKAADQSVVGSTTSGFLVSVASKDGTVRETFSTVDYPGTTGTYPYGINDSGQIIGAYSDSAGDSHAFELIDGSYATLVVPFAGAVETEAYGINNAGDIVGCWALSADDVIPTYGFELAGGTYTNLQFPGQPYTCPFAINNKGDIVGAYQTDRNVIYGFLFRGGTYTTVQVPGAIFTEVDAINDSGDMAGLYCPPGACAGDNLPGAQGFVLRKGVFTTIVMPGASYTSVDGIGNSGVITGAYADSAGNDHGFIGVPQ
jgi:probable HAF family extracellular repeat protein